MSLTPSNFAFLIRNSQAAEGILLVGFLNEELPIITQHLLARLGTGSGQTLPLVLHISVEDMHLTPTQALLRAQQSLSHQSQQQPSSITADNSTHSSNSSSSGDRSGQPNSTASRADGAALSESGQQQFSGTPAVAAGRLVFFTGTSWHSLAGPLNDELVELGLAPALVATATSPEDNHVEVREVSASGAVLKGVQACSAEECTSSQSDRVLACSAAEQVV